jgi:predicted ATPase
MGDGVLVYFGYPQAHEDDAERAVRAGVELIQAVGGLNSSASLQTRVGIATGLVVVGDLIGSGAAQEQTVVGETPNLASRLQGMADPNTLVIAESTRKLLGNLFDVQDLGAQDLKGMGAPVRAWAVLRPATVESRFEALHATGLTELVGREEELELLLRRWSKAKTGEGQVVLLSGEAGIGKSRLTVALLESIASEPHTRLRYFCSPQHTDSAFYPIIGQMERAAGFAHGDRAQVKLDKLDALLAQTSTSKQDAGLFAEMLSLPNDGRYPALDLDPQQRRQKTLEALTAQMEALSRQKPVLMIFEDAHWTDPTSLETFGRVVDKVRSLPVLLIVTFRPEFDPPWIGRPYVTALTLNRLAERHIETVIDKVVGNKLIPPSMRQDIIERTDGIPLFVEEMTKALLETGDEATQQIVASFPSPALAVPASLQASLMARLDRLGPAKEVAQVGAAIGREFSHPLLAAVMHERQIELNSALDRLIASGLLFRHGARPHATYLFKHALVQDAAYGTLLREPRRALHARIAETLEKQFAEIAENQPELLARHCTEAGLSEKAFGLWGKAAERSLARSALAEAIDQLTRGLAQIAILPPTPALRRQEITFQVALITPLLHVKGFAAPEPKAAAQRARQLIEHAESLGETPEDPLLMFSALYGLWVASLVAFNGELCRDLAAHFLALAEKTGMTFPLMVGHRLMGTALLGTGDVVRSRMNFERALAFYDPDKHRPLAVSFGQDVRQAILIYRSWAHWILGYPQAALADAEYALQDAREIGQAPTLMAGLALTGLTHILCGNYSVANAQSEELIALADKKTASLWKAWGVMNQGCVLAATGKAAGAIETIAVGIAAWRSTGATAWMTSYLSALANAYAELRQLENACRSISEAISALETSKERWYEAEVLRVAGEIELQRVEPDQGKAETYFHRSLEVARNQEAKSWELRTAMSMARRWCDQGQSQPARDLLAPLYNWFTEGFDTLDLRKARELLKKLAT